MAVRHEPVPATTAEEENRRAKREVVDRRSCNRPADGLAFAVVDANLVGDSTTDEIDPDRMRPNLTPVPDIARRAKEHDRIRFRHGGDFRERPVPGISEKPRLKCPKPQQHAPLRLRAASPETAALLEPRCRGDRVPYVVASPSVVSVSARLSSADLTLSARSRS
jgi:hypothetical protein